MSPGPERLPADSPAEGEVHVWHASLEVPPATRAALAGLLGGDERERAARFRMDRDRRRFEVARGLLRLLLGRCCGAEPAALRLGYAEHGKPHLTAPEAPFDFNLSHSAERVVVALSRAVPVGVDVEALDREVEVEALAARFFAPEEAAALAALPEGERARAFLAVWTRKEAYLKAQGTGLSRPLASFAVSLSRAEPRLLFTRPDPEEAGRWSVHDLEVGPGYVASLVARRPTSLRVREWSWEEGSERGSGEGSDREGR